MFCENEIDLLSSWRYVETKIHKNFSVGGKELDSITMIAIPPPPPPPPNIHAIFKLILTLSLASVPCSKHVNIILCYVQIKNFTKEQYCG